MHITIHIPTDYYWKPTTTKENKIIFRIYAKHKSHIYILTFSRLPHFISFFLHFLHFSWIVVWSSSVIIIMCLRVFVVSLLLLPHSTLFELQNVQVLCSCVLCVCAALLATSLSLIRLFSSWFFVHRRHPSKDH